MAKPPAQSDDPGSPDANRALGLKRADRPAAQVDLPAQLHKAGQAVVTRPATGVLIENDPQRPRMA